MNLEHFELTTTTTTTTVTTTTTMAVAATTTTTMTMGLETLTCLEPQVCFFYIILFLFY